MLNQGEKYLAEETFIKKIVQSSKTMPHSRKNILQFNHGEKNPAHPRVEKEFACAKNCPPPPQKSNDRSLSTSRS